MWQEVGADGRKKHERLYQQGKPHGSFHPQALRLLPCCLCYVRRMCSVFLVLARMVDDDARLPGPKVEYRQAGRGTRRFQPLVLPDSRFGVGQGLPYWRWLSRLTIRNGIAEGDCYRWLLEVCGERAEGVVPLGVDCSHGSSVGCEPRGHRCGRSAPRKWPDDGESGEWRSSGIIGRAGEERCGALRIGIAETGRIGCGVPNPMRCFRTVDYFLSFFLSRWVGDDQNGWHGQCALAPTVSTHCHARGR